MVLLPKLFIVSIVWQLLLLCINMYAKEIVIYIVHAVNIL